MSSIGDTATTSWDTDAERATLEGLDERLRAGIQEVVDSAALLPDGGNDAAYLARMSATVRQLAARLDAELPAHLDARAVADVRGGIITILGLLLDAGDDDALGVLDRLLVEAEAIRHVLRDALDDELALALAPAREQLAMLETLLGDVPQRRLATLLGTSTRTLQRLASDEDAAAPRQLTLVVRLATVLVRHWTPAGVVAWFGRPQPALDGARPQELLQDPGAEPALLALVRTSRAMHGA